MVRECRTVNEGTGQRLSGYVKMLRSDVADFLRDHVFTLSDADWMSAGDLTVYWFVSGMLLGEAVNGVLNTIKFMRILCSICAQEIWQDW